MPTAHLRDIARVVNRAMPEHTNGRANGANSEGAATPGRHKTTSGSSEYSQPFNHVFSGPEQRSIDTAEHFGKPIILKGLDAWFRGAHEGKAASFDKIAMRALILSPDKKPPGVNSITGLAGESYNQFWKPLGHAMRELTTSLKPKERLLIVTSGGNLQAIDQLAASNFPAKLTPEDLKKIAAKPYWSEVGTLFLLTRNGLKKVTDNQAFGIYAIEHAATAFNPISPANAKENPKPFTNGHGSKASEVPQLQGGTGKTEQKEHDYSTTQLNLPEDISSHIRKFASKIPKEHLAEEGRETEPHITLLYGIHSDDPNEAKAALKGHGPVKVNLRHTSLFPASPKHPEHDVLKMEVHSPDLDGLRAKLQKGAENTQTYSGYKPHVTVAYLKPGMGKKYAAKMIPNASGKKVSFDKVAFRSKNGESTDIPLNAKDR